jgi:hypothetical protein
MHRLTICLSDAVLSEERSISAVALFRLEICRRWGVRVRRWMPVTFMTVKQTELNRRRLDTPWVIIFYINSIRK